VVLEAAAVVLGVVAVAVAAAAVHSPGLDRALSRANRWRQGERW
jgi:Spy/CpxP family protein refolding chaperone